MTCLFPYVSCVLNAYVCVLSRHVSCVSYVSSSFLLWLPFPRVSPAPRLNFHPEDNANQDNMGFASSRSVLSTFFSSLNVSQMMPIAEGLIISVGLKTTPQIKVPATAQTIVFF